MESGQRQMISEKVQSMLDVHFGQDLGRDRGCIFTGAQYRLAEPFTIIECFALSGDLLILFKEVWHKSLSPAGTKWV